MSQEQYSTKDRKFKHLNEYQRGKILRIFGQRSIPPPKHSVFDRQITIFIQKKHPVKPDAS